MDIAWKTVRPESRESFMAPWPFRLIYEKGSIVRAPENTLGIMCFETEKDATRFCMGRNNCEIIRVRPIGDIIKPLKISLGLTNGLIRRFYIEKDDIATTSPPAGTICCPAVEVLE